MPIVFHPSEHTFHYSRGQSILIAEHRVCLPAARAPIGKDGPIVPLQKLLRHFLAYCLKDLSLADFTPEHPIKLVYCAIAHCSLLVEDLHPVDVAPVGFDPQVTTDVAGLLWDGLAPALTVLVGWTASLGEEWVGLLGLVWRGMGSGLEVEFEVDVGGRLD